MSESIIGAVEKFITNNAQFYPNWMWIEFFGGEPLTCFDLVIKIAKHAKRVCSLNNVRFIGGITTNGVLLTKEKIEILYKSGICQFQITLDGTPDFHDNQRPMISGKGTWHKIWYGLLGLKESSRKFRVIIRIHYRISHLYQAVDLVRYYINPVFSGDNRFFITFQEIKAFGKVIIENNHSWSEKKMAIDILEQALHNKEMLMPSVEICYAVNPDTILIMPDGGLSNCTIKLKKFGQLKEDGSLELNDEPMNVICEKCIPTTYASQRKQTKPDRSFKDLSGYTVP